MVIFFVSLYITFLNRLSLILFVTFELNTIIGLVEPIVVNVNFISVPVCHRFHVAKSVFRHLHVLSLATQIFLTVDIVYAFNFCNFGKYVSLTHDICKVFSSTHNSICIPRHISCLENNNTIKSFTIDKFTFFF